MTVIDHPPLDHLYTFEQFLTAFDGVHADWLPDGRVEIHRMGTSAEHILLIQWLVRLLGDYLSFEPVGQVLSESFVQRLSADLPAREPDILVVMNEHQNRLHNTHLNGAADIVIEVVSPERVERDYGTKFREYEQGGVREYWLIDPERLIADVYELGENRRYHRRPLDAEGRLTSGVLTRFVLSPNLLWSSPKPDAIATLKLVAAMVNKRLSDLL